MSTSDKLSLITIVKGREEHLQRQLEGVARSSYIPDEILIVAIDEYPKLDGFTDLAFKVVLIKSNKGPIPIARARNTGAEAASFENLVFLDVDCIPHHTFFEKLFYQGKNNRTLIMGTPRYLTKSVKSGFSDSWLHNKSLHHPHRPVVNELEVSHDWMLFWSLCFYIPRSLFLELEGFDENYTGYGAEDTDLALKLKHKGGYRFMLSEACVYHQQHPVYSPPVHQLDPIISNAQFFHEKWGRWVMENWLSSFKSQGLIDWEEGASRIFKKAKVTDALLEECYRPEAPFM